MQTLTVDSDSPEQTQLLGSYLGQLARSADVFLLVGELGAGKTCLVQGIADGLAVKDHAFSPSFVIVREYHGRLPLYHIDLYRLGSLSEITSLGLEDYLYGDGVCAVEWADRGMEAFPGDSLLVSLRYTPGSETRRSIVIRPQGERYREVTSELALMNGLSFQGIHHGTDD